MNKLKEKWQDFEIWYYSDSEHSKGFWGIIGCVSMTILVSWAILPSLQNIQVPSRNMEWLMVAIPVVMVVAFFVALILFCSVRAMKSEDTIYNQDNKDGGKQE